MKKFKQKNLTVRNQHSRGIICIFIYSLENLNLLAQPEYKDLTNVTCLDAPDILAHFPRIADF